MDRYSVKSFNGIPLFEIPRDDFGQRSLFEQPLPPAGLAEELLGSFAGRTLTLPEIVRRHSPGTPYVERNYREALSHLVGQGKITCAPPPKRCGSDRASEPGRREPALRSRHDSKGAPWD